MCISFQCRTDALYAWPTCIPAKLYYKKKKKKGGARALLGTSDPENGPSIRVPTASNILTVSKTVRTEPHLTTYMP